MEFTRPNHIVKIRRKRSKKNAKYIQQTFHKTEEETKTVLSIREKYEGKNVLLLICCFFHFFVRRQIQSKNYHRKENKVCVCVYVLKSQIVFSLNLRLFFRKFIQSLLVGKLHEKK